MVGTVTFSVKRSNPHAVGTQYTVGMQCTVGVSAKKVKSHSALSKYGWWGLLPSVKKGQTPHTVGTQYADGMQCALGVSAKRSTGTVDLANMGGAKRSNTTQWVCSMQ